MTTIVQHIDNPILADKPPINLKWAERYLSVIVGVKVGLSGFRHLFSSPVASILKIGTGGYLLNRGITGHCDIYEKAGKINQEPVDIDILTSVLIDKPRDEVYGFWRKLDNLPLFMEHLKSVELLGSERSRWTLKVPANIPAVSWHSEITYDKPGEIIAWGSVPDSVIQTTGKIRFVDTPIPNTTLVHVAITYQPPAGGVGASVAQLLNPLFQKMVEDDVQNFKRYMDVGSIISAPGGLAESLKTEA